MSKWHPTDIPAGTKFYVHNGDWYGSITEENGQRYLLCFSDLERTHLVNKVLLTSDKGDELTITIQK